MQQHLKIMTLTEAAKLLRMPTTSVYRYARQGKLPAFRLGKHWRIVANDLEAFLSTVEARHDAR